MLKDRQIDRFTLQRIVFPEAKSLKVRNPEPQNNPNTP
jgi:hypothetical protein